MDEEQKGSGRSLRGFASMDKEKQRVIASKGGRAAHEKGTAHEFSSHEASQAAKKGHERGTAHEFTADEARVAGRKGGLARAMNRTRAATGAAGGHADGCPHHGQSESTNRAEMAGEGAVGSARSEGRDMSGMGAGQAAHNPG